MRKIYLGTINLNPKYEERMAMSQAVSDAWAEAEGETVHITDFAWWDDYTLIAYLESKAVDLLNDDDREILMQELSKRGLR